MQAALEELFKDNFQQTLKYVAIGSSTYTGAKDLTGEIDNVSFFNTALTAEQTKALYDADGVAQVEITDPGETDPGETDPGETDPGESGNLQKHRYTVSILKMVQQEKEHLRKSLCKGRLQ